MNTHKKINNYIPNGFILFFIVLSLCSVTFATMFLNPVFKHNVAKLSLKSEKSYSTTKVTGIVESIHPWGSREVVPIKGIRLEYYTGIDKWVLYGDVSQPNNSKDYFMPVLTGTLTIENNIGGVQQLCESYGYSANDDLNLKPYQDFRVANIVLKDNKPFTILYYHYRYHNDAWMIIATWEAKF